MAEHPPLQLTFASNALMQDLCGRHDSHLQLIEERLGVQVVPRGNQLAVFGPPEQARKAQNVLEELYDLLRQGIVLSPAQIEATLRLSDGLLDNQPRPAVTANGLAGSHILTTPNKKILPRTATQGRYMEALASTTLVFGVGPAGTGKTYLAAAAAVQLLAQKKVEKLILTRPVVEAGERLGFLPGTFEEKIDPYLRPLFDALDDTFGRDRWQKMRLISGASAQGAPAEGAAGHGAGQIEIAPLAYMRGRTLRNCAMLLDEAQNTTPAQMKMFLTRLGEGSTAFVTGDLTQSDLPRGQRNGLKDATEVLDGLRDISVIRFSEADVVRHPLVSTIVGAYAERDRQMNLRLDE